MTSHLRSTVLWALLVFVAGAIYVSQHWSPSSYGTFLRDTGQPGAGLVFGEPRPVRSDEWGVVTPLTQAAVNNGFQRFNRTSLYGEDLRINYGLPLADWGLAFKPTLWPYFWAEPARAFSFHWYAILALFICGYAWLFMRIGLSRAVALLLSVGLYFTPFVQFWWNEKGPVMAFFPWVVGVLLMPWPLALRLLACYWLGTSWMLTNFYPPMFVSLAFVGALLLAALEPQWLRPRRLAGLALAAGAAGLTAFLYLKDYIGATARTVYPGQRSVSGGAVPWPEWWAQLMPHVTFDANYASALQKPNLNGVVGAAFVLVVLCCLDYARLRALLASDARLRRLAVLLGTGLLLMYAWMLLPLPWWAGAPLLWNHVLPDRMHYAAGLTLLVLAALAADRAGLRLTVRRCAVHALLLIAGWLVLNCWNDAQAFVQAWRLRAADLLMLPLLGASVLLAKRWRWRPAATALAASTATGACVMFGFNPIQSAEPIFAQPTPAVRRALEAERIDGGRGPVAAAGYFGATINGLGYPSVTHVTPVPALDYWRQRYPHLSQQEFMSVFNRYSHIRLKDTVSVPEVDFADAVAIPLRDYWPKRLPWPDGLASHPLGVRWVEQGESVLIVEPAPMDGLVEGVAVMVGTSQGKADGRLEVRLCQAGHCASAAADVRQARDNALLRMSLQPPLHVRQGAALEAQVTLSGGTNAIGGWLYARTAPNALAPTARWELDYR